MSYIDYINSLDKNILAAILSIILYLLYVLIPLMPSILIYKLFPKTRVSLSGPLKGLTMKATGAFAAYVIILLLGYTQIDIANNMINRLTIPPDETQLWTVETMVELRNYQNEVIEDDKLIKTTEISIQPDLILKSGKHIHLKLPKTVQNWPNHLIRYSIPGFGENTFNLNDIDENLDYGNKILNISNPIIIKISSNHARPYNELQQPIVGEPSGGPPKNL